MEPAIQLSFQSGGKKPRRRVSFNRGGRGEAKRPALLLAAVGGAETERDETAAAASSGSSGVLGAPGPAMAAPCLVSSCQLRPPGL